MDVTAAEGRTGGAGRRVWGHALARTMIRRLAPLMLCSAMACTPLYQMHGYVPDETLVKEIRLHQDNRDTVAAFLGRPSTEGLLGDTAWYYVQSKWETVGAHAPKEIDRQVLAISFDKDGLVSNVERFGLERGEIVPLSRRVTTETVKGRSVLAQIFASFGHIDAAQLFKNRD